MASSSIVLEDVPSVDLMTELLRRFKCSSQPDKRLVLIGRFVVYAVLGFFWAFLVFVFFVIVGG